MRNINIVVYTGGNMIVALVPFILTPFLTHNLSPAEYGTIAMFQLMVGMFCIFVGLSTNGPLLRFNYNKNVTAENRSAYFYNANLVLIASFLTLYIAVCVFDDYISNLINVNVETLHLSLWTSLFAYFIKVRLGQWQVNYESIKYATIQLMQSVLLITLFFVLYYYLFDDSRSRIYSYIFVIIIISTCCIFSLFKDGYYKNRKISKSYINDLLNQGIGILPHLLGIYIISFSDRIIVNKFMDERSVGILMLAIQVSLVLNLLFDGVNKALNPSLFRILKNNDTNEKKRVVKITWLIVLACLLITYPLSWVGYYVVVWISSVEYHQAADLVRVIMVSQVLNGLYLAFVNYILYSKKLWVLSSISVSTGVFGIVLTLLLIEEYGIYAPVISGLFSAVLRLVAVFFASKRLVSMPWFNFYRV